MMEARLLGTQETALALEFPPQGGLLSPESIIISETLKKRNFSSGFLPLRLHNIALYFTWFYDVLGFCFTLYAT